MRKKPADPTSVPANGDARPDLRAALREDARVRGEDCLARIRAACAETRCQLIVTPTIEEDGRLGARWALRPEA